MISAAGLVLDPARRRVWPSGAPERGVRLPPAQATILEALFAANGRTVSREALVARCQAKGISQDPDARVVDTHLSKIRAKLAALGADDVIRTLWREGWYVPGGQFGVICRYGPGQDSARLPVAGRGRVTRLREALWHAAALLAQVGCVVFRIDPLKDWEEPR